MKSLLSICDVQNEITEILDLANKFKQGLIKGKPLDGKSLAMIFQKSSTRTRVSFEVGMYELGGYALFLSENDLQMGRGEPITDTAKVLSRYVDGAMIRAINHEDLVEFEKVATIPIINGLSNLEHPCQALADMQTVKENKGNFDGKFVYVGDGNNVCNSLLLICACLGMDIEVASPNIYQPNSKIIAKAKAIAKETDSKVNITDDVENALKDADVVYTDVWVSMGDEEEQAKRMNALAKYQVNSKLMKLAHEDAIFMHCLPAIRGQEVSANVIDGENSVIIDQAENRLHAQKAILCHLLE